MTLSGRTLMRSGVTAGALATKYALFGGNPTPEDVSKRNKLFIISAILIFIMFLVAYRTEISRAEKEGREPLTRMEFLGFTSKYGIKEIMVAMASNVVFGFIDNAGLFFGMDALDPFLPEGELSRAALGNTFSDGLGSFLGTFAGKTISNMTLIDEGPLWAEVIGIIIGCILGLYIPKMITGKQ